MSIQKTLAYIGRHWRGELPLGIAFWVNLVGIGLVVFVIENLAKHSVINQPERLLVVAIVSLLLFRLILYPWQAMGVLRSCERALMEYKNVIWIRCAQAVAVLGILVIFVDGLQVLRLYISMRHERAELARLAADNEITYTLNLQSNNYAHLKGFLEPGITKELKALTDQHPTIDTIILDSEGGRVYEARGIAVLAEKRGLGTYSTTGCYSACTIAFAGGVKRALAPNAQMGFHRYKLDAKYALPFMDVDKELEKDFKFLLQRGIDTSFLEKVFDTPPESMWVPSHKVLLEAGVIHDVAEIEIK